MTSETFSSFYWYKGEFKNICSQYGLPRYGTLNL
ncbi:MULTISPECIES: SAP domain-containing protein [Lacticaseibacillus]|nr:MULTISPECIES: SAP domain-containing protein [Lacticaseibacillus]MCR1926178.1 SAP domain-containing protein [Lacticaseibacillus paracasei]MDB7797087.1 SAP domain-containing protein [Lacticaseibacillus paracasei]MDY0839681.1 SAP domain-containing protein [Lacticaseibacillus paracasei]UEM72746.1 SAP domain-containing protein [Lacticaseibacillus rhamnosus]UVH24991.1 SAP domain-containing protein [Lacticaseibacillus paracasei]